MPSYSYGCNRCNDVFEVFAYLADYKPKVKCPKCKRLCGRDYTSDQVNGSVKLADSEIKNLHHLAMRNTEKFSEDYKAKLYQEHNSYKYKGLEVPLPKNTKKQTRGKRPKWT